jgi:hypothetical protein
MIFRQVRSSKIVVGIGLKEGWSLICGVFHVYLEETLLVEM